ncbi:hypothetical protein AAVH_11986 [Aphelenchoides avenae]|nr:hypothetical protein AAVH_11986 [Aphelenchus avenae]
MHPLVLNALSIPKFSGDIRAFSMFRNRFLETVEGRKDLPPWQKFLYLLQHLADESLLDLRRFHNEARRLIDEIRQAEEEGNGNSLWKKTLFNKLTPSMRPKISEHFGSDLMDASIESFLTRLREYVRLVESSDLSFSWKPALSTAGNSGSGSRQCRPGPRSTAYRAETYATYAANEKRSECSYCGRGTHRASKCDIYPTISQRLRPARQLDYCFLASKEATGLEPAPRRRTKRADSAIKDITISPSARMRSPSDAFLNVNNGLSPANVFFDSASNISYIGIKLARVLQLPYLEKCLMHVNTFGTYVVTTVEGFATTVLLRSPQGASVALTLTASSRIVPPVTTALVANDEVQLLKKNKCALISTREKPDLLMGQDLFHLFERRFGPQIPSGFHDTWTCLGPVAGGAGRADADPVVEKPDSVPADNAGSEPGNSTVVDASTFLCGLPSDPDAALFEDFSHVENAGVGTSKRTPDDQAAADMLKKIHKRHPDGRYEVPLLFRTPDG